MSCETFHSVDDVRLFIQREELIHGVKFVTQTKSKDFGNDSKLYLISSLLSFTLLCTAWLRVGRQCAYTTFR